MKYNRKINFSCRYFTGDKPCKFHKRDGSVCGSCGYYSPSGERILIVKLGAMGDVIRTTFLLPGLKEKYPDSHITWVVSRGSAELLYNLEDIDLLLELSPETVSALNTLEFDIILSLDPSFEGGAVAASAHGKLKKGFGLDKNGKLHPFDEKSGYWYLSGIFDDLKKENTLTYQQMVKDITGIPDRQYEVSVNLNEKELECKKDFMVRNGLAGQKPVIGLNTGAGSKWKLKKWTPRGYLELIGMIAENLDADILLYGGEREKDTNRWLAGRSPHKIIDTGASNSLREFFALLDISDIIVTGDTLAMHAALGLKKKVAALFGPSSHSEICLYGRGIKIISPAECICCYLPECRRTPSCMELITPSSVFNAVKALMG